jgi:hypothetical protein
LIESQDTFCEEMYNLDNDSFLNSLETVNVPSSYWNSRNCDSDVWRGKKNVQVIENCGIRRNKSAIEKKNLSTALSIKTVTDEVKLFVFM